MIGKTLSWNIRGFGDVDKRTAINSVLMRCNPDVMLLQETKLQNFTLQQRRSLEQSRC